MEITGKVYHIGEEVQVSQTFTKRQLVIETEEQYPQFIPIDFTQGKFNLELDGLKHSNLVIVSINIRGSKYNDKVTGEEKFIANLQGWKIQLQQSNQMPPAQQKETEPDF